MNDVNGWLLVVAFVLGLLLTFAFMIRRDTREVPDCGTGDFEIADPEPFGDGSVRLERGSQIGPPCHPIKADENSMRYHTADSPAYQQTIAEVWFADEETAAKAGFAPGE